MGVVDAEKATAVAALHNIHESWDILGQNIEIWSSANHHYVATTAKVNARSIYLPPCIPKQSVLYKRSDHPFAVEIVVKTMGATQEGHDGMQRATTLFAVPEFHPPRRKETTGDTAAVESTAAAESAAVAENTALAEQWHWGEAGAETMHPFWAVRRLTQNQLDVCNTKVKPDQLRRRFNCELELKSQSVVCLSVGSTSNTNCNRTRLIEVPFMTNSVPLEEGEELILRIEEKKQPTPKKRSWRDEVKDAERQSKKQKSL